MDNRNIVDIVNNPLQLGQCDISTSTDFVIDLCHQGYFEIQTIEILHNLNKLKHYREYFNYQNHPSIPNILKNIGELMAQTCKSQLAIPFFIEQLRIEKYYLGCHHPDLASVLYSIGQIYEKNDQLVESRKYFIKAISLLENGKRKGRLHALLMYQIGLVNFRLSSYKDALEKFDLAIIEHRTVYGDYHPTVGEICMKIGILQLEIGKLQDAMNNCLEALVILRMVSGNDHSKVAQCLYIIGLIHEAKAEFSESLNALSQAFNINENAEDYDDDDDDTFSLVILHRIGLVYQSKEDMNQANKVFENLKSIIKLKASDDDDEKRLLISFGLNICIDSPDAAAAA